MYTRPDFWRKYAAPYLLMFHLDSRFCPSPTRSLQSFIDSGYSFAGAPWAVGSVRHSVASPSTQKRTASATAVSRFGGATILQLTTAIESSGKDEFAKHRMMYTDLWFSAHLQSKHWSSLNLSAVPTEVEAAYFAVESTDLVPGATPVGVHLNKHQIQSKKYLSTREEQSPVHRCPALAEVFYRLDATRHVSRSRV